MGNIIVIGGFTWCRSGVISETSSCGDTNAGNIIVIG